MNRPHPTVGPALMAALLLALLLGTGAFAPPLRAHGPTPKPEHVELMKLAPHTTTTHFRFFGQPDVHSTLEKLAAVAEDRFQHLCRPLDACNRLEKPIDIWVADDAESFAAAFPDENPMSEWAAGVAFLRAQRVVLRAHGTALFSLMETFDHELAHILHHTFVADHTGRALPRWYAEGLAIWQAGESVIDRLDAAVKAAASGNLLTFEELNARFPNDGSRVAVGYAQSALFVRRLVKHHGVQPVVSLLHDVSSGETFDAAFERRFGSPPGVLFDELSDALEEASNPFVFLYDGNFLWGATTVLFLFVAWMKVRDRKRQLQRLAESEADRIANEDIALYLEREERERLAAQRRAETPEPPDPTLLN